MPSYLVAHSSRDVVVLAHQVITRQWWDEALSHYEVFISQVVVEEASGGDPEAAKRRLGLLAHFPILGITEQVETLAGIYVDEMTLPPKAFRDALHMALASFHGMHYLVTWNCRHIARGHIKRLLAKINGREGIDTPTICTPEELFGEQPCGEIP